MRGILVLVAFMVFATATCAGRADAATTVEVVETWPAGDTVTLHRHQSFYLHLHYTSDQPVHVWARPYFQGEPAKAGSNPSRIHPAGSGEALGWFFLDPGGQVDEVRISAGDGSPDGTHVVATWPVMVTTEDTPALTASPPAWVATLRAADKAAADADYRKAMNTPATAGDIAFFTVFMLAMVALGLLGLAWPAWGLWRWRDGWRIVAAIPAAVMAFVVLRILVGTGLDPTSHNLWPFEIVMWGGLSCVWMLVAGLAHKFSGAGRA
jgi:hypothetical protein